MSPPPDTSPPGAAYAESDWLHLTHRLRQRLVSLHRQTAGTHLAQEANLVVIDANRLCDYVERLHREAHRWMAANPQPHRGPQSPSADLASTELQHAAIDVQREQHETSENAIQFMKALLMWVDTPDERARNVGESTNREPPPPT